MRLPPRSTLAFHAIEFQVGDAKHGLDGSRSAAQQGPHPRRKFGERKWLDKAIVSAGVERLHAIFDPATRGEYQHRKRRLLGTHGAQHADAVELGQVQIENQQIVFALESHLPGLFAIGRDIDRVMFCLQAFADKAGERSVVFHNQDAHTDGPWRVTNQWLPRSSSLQRWPSQRICPVCGWAVSNSGKTVLH